MYTVIADTLDGAGFFCAAAVAEHSVIHKFGMDRERCISCMHCIAVCPVKARHNNKLLLSAAAQKMKKSRGCRKENQLFLP